MLYQIVEPFNMSINANSFANAVKHLVKMNQELKVRELIIGDEYDQYKKANLTFYNNNDKQKVAISLYPTVWPLGIKSNNEIYSPLSSWPYSPSITYDTKEYPSTTFLTNSFIPKIVPLTSSLNFPLTSSLNFPLNFPLTSSLNYPYNNFLTPLSNVVLPNLAGTVVNY